MYSDKTIEKHERLMKTARQLVDETTREKTAGVGTKMFDFLSGGTKKVDDALSKIDDVSDTSTKAMDNLGSSAVKTTDGPMSSDLRMQADDLGLEDQLGDAAEEGGSALGSIGKGLGLAGIGAGIGAGGYMAGRNEGVSEGEQNRNLAFGAGLATGAVTPELTRRVANIYQQTKQPQPKVNNAIQRR